MKVDAAYASLPKVGETANGDCPIVRTDDSRCTLVAVMDGLGHGPEAALASQRAAQHLLSTNLDAALVQIMEGLHRELAGTRGAAGTVCLIRGGAVEACAVGNVEVRSGELRLPLVSSAGVLGVRVPKFRPCLAQVSSAVRLVLFSDGISSRTRVEDYRRLSPRAACDEIIHRHRRQEDDATVLVADVE
jgi:hypothetical protein